MFVEMWIFLFKCFEKHIWEPFEHLEQFACDSEWMCAKVWARVVVEKIRKHTQFFFKKAHLKK